MELEISELIESMGKAVSQAQQDIEKQALHRFFDYFDEKAEDGVFSLQAKSAKVALPTGQDITAFHPVGVPLVSLVHHRQVTLEKVTMKMNLQLECDQDKVLKVNLNAPAPGGMSNELQNDKVNSENTQSIEIVFQVTDSTDGMSRVVKDINRQL